MYELKVGILPYPKEKIARLSRERIELLTPYWKEKSLIPEDVASLDNQKRIDSHYADILRTNSEATYEVLNQKRNASLAAINSLRRVIIALGKEERKLGNYLSTDGYNGFSPTVETGSERILMDLRNLHDNAKKDSNVGLDETLSFVDTSEYLGKFYLSNHRDIDLSRIGVQVPALEFETPNHSQFIYGPVVLGIELIDRYGGIIESEDSKLRRMYGARIIGKEGLGIVI